MTELLKIVSGHKSLTNKCYKRLGVKRLQGKYKERRKKSLNSRDLINTDERERTQENKKGNENENEQTEQKIDIPRREKKEINKNVSKKKKGRKERKQIPR